MEARSGCSADDPRLTPRQRWALKNLSFLPIDNHFGVHLPTARKERAKKKDNRSYDRHDQNKEHEEQVENLRNTVTQVQSQISEAIKASQSDESSDYGKVLGNLIRQVNPEIRIVAFTEATASITKYIPAPAPTNTPQQFVATQPPIPIVPQQTQQPSYIPRFSPSDIQVLQQLSNSSSSAGPHQH